VRQTRAACGETAPESDLQRRPSGEAKERDDRRMQRSVVRFMHKNLVLQALVQDGNIDASPR